VMIRGNKAAKNGGGLANSVSSLHLTNGVIDRNVADQDGGGIYDDGIKSAELFNVVVSGNTAGNIVGGIYTLGDQFSLINSMVWDNARVDGTVDNLYGSSIDVSHSLLQGNPSDWEWGTNGTGNNQGGNIVVATSPFVSAEEGD